MTDRMQRAENERARLRSVYQEQIARRDARIRELERALAGKPDTPPTPIPRAFREAFAEEDGDGH